MHRNVKLIPLFDTIQLIEMSDEEYFSDKWAGYISNSKLALINPDQDGSPQIYKEGLSKHSKYSDSLVFGSAVHELVLQPGEFKVADNVDRPTAKMGAMADELYRTFLSNKGVVSDDDIIAASNKIDYYKGKMDSIKIENVKDKCINYWWDRRDWESEHNNSEIEPIYLDPKSREKLQLCLASVEANKEVQDLLHPKGVFEEPISMNEAALFMDVKAEHEGKETILKLKGKLDNFTIDIETNEVVLNDLKTTGHWLIDFGDSFKKYHYNRQMAMYAWMLRSYVEKQYNIKPSSLMANMLLVCTVPDYRAGVFRVTNGEIRKGFLEFKDLLQRVAYCELYD
jgi:hypothetical protein